MSVRLYPYLVCTMLYVLKAVPPILPSCFFVVHDVHGIEGEEEIVFEHLR